MTNPGETVDIRGIVKAARAVARDPGSADLRGALKGMLNVYDELTRLRAIAPVTEEMVERFCRDLLALTTPVLL
jgi:hypothetical protein